MMFMTLIRHHAAIVAALAALLATGTHPLPAVAQSGANGGSSAVVKLLDPPRFHSLKSDRVNVRRGPGLKFPIVWVFRRVGMPVEVIREFDNWWQVRDSEGAEGWVYKGLLARRRTALLMPWQEGQSGTATTGTTEASAGAGADGAPARPLELRDTPDRNAGIVAYAEPGTIANVRECDGRWCRIVIEPFEGWIEQRRLWGVYAREAIRP